MPSYASAFCNVDGHANGWIRGANTDHIGVTIVSFSDVGDKQLEVKEQ